MATTPPLTAPVVDILIEGLKQGVDYVIPIQLELAEGETDEAALDFDQDDVGVLRMYQASPGLGGVPKFNEQDLRFTFSTSAGTMILYPEEHVIELHLANEMNKTLTPNKLGLEFRGTLYLEDMDGNSRPVSGQDVAMPMEPSYK